MWRYLFVILDFFDYSCQEVALNPVVSAERWRCFVELAQDSKF